MTKTRTQTAGSLKKKHSYFPLIGKSIAEENLRFFKPRKQNIIRNSTMDPYQPQRVELPVYFNTPLRKDALFDKTKYMQRTRSKLGFNSKVVLNSKSIISMSYIDPAERVQFMKRIKDYTMLAFACKRANKTRDEGRAYYSIGVLYDNLAQYKEAINWYRKFLSVCNTIGDDHGIGLSYNCIGISYQKLGDKGNYYLKMAIKYHQKHYHAGDTAAKFIASINMGLIYEQLGENEKATECHKEALRYANEVSSLVGQAVALGNLGRIGTQSRMIQDSKQLKELAEKYLHCSSELGNVKNKAEAHIQLGKIDESLGNYEECAQNLCEVRKLVKEIGNVDNEDEVSVRLGVVNAQMNWNRKVDKVLKNVNFGNDF